MEILFKKNKKPNKKGFFAQRNEQLDDIYDFQRGKPSKSKKTPVKNKTKKK